MENEQSLYFLELIWSARKNIRVRDFLFSYDINVFKKCGDIPMGWAGHFLAFINIVSH